MVSKRKRDSESPVGDDNASRSSKQQEPMESKPHFKVEVFPDGATNVKRRRSGPKGKNRDWSDLKRDEDAPFGGSPLIYSVSPGKEWEVMKKYKNFVVAPTTFGTGDFIFVNHTDAKKYTDVDEEESFWVAKVLEVRAVSQSKVYLRIVWMYYPEELPGGRQSYHGRQELVASNHMEIIDAMTVSDKAKVSEVVETQEDAPSVDGLFWRQTFNFRTGQLSTLRKDCICNSYHNPDNLLVRCPNSSCGKWLHEACILEDALKSTWAKISSSEEETKATDTNGDATADTIKVGAADARSKHGKNSKTNGTLSRRRKRGKRPKEEIVPWEGKLEAKLEMSNGDDESSTQDTTGRILITDLRKLEDKEIKVEPVKEEINEEQDEADIVEELHCLACNTKIV